MFDWLFGKVERPFNLKNRFSEVNEDTGKTCWYEHIDYDCSICGAPGFTCENIINCRYAPDSVVCVQPTNR